MIASTVNILISRNNRVKFPPRFLLSLLFVNFHPTPNFHSFHSRPFKTVRRIDLYLSRPMHLSLLMVKLDDTRGLTFKNDSLYYDIHDSVKGFSYFIHSFSNFDQVNNHEDR